MKTRVYKMTLLLVDHDDLGEEGVRHMLEHTRYPNHAIGPSVMQVETREVEWSDEHPLNSLDTQEATFCALFEESG